MLYQKKDFLNSQLNDSRYISKATKDYLAQLGSDITTSKGKTTSWLRHQWGLNTILGETGEKERSDHRHHAIDAVVIACVDRGFYQALVNTAKDLERRSSTLKMRDLVTDPSWDTLRDDLKERLEEVVISHAPQKKLNGELHEATGVGFIEGIGTVNRTNLDPGFKLTQIDKIIDPEVKHIVFTHLQKYGNDPKKAFTDDVSVYHKNGKTPIKRVRIVQAKTTLKELEKDKVGVKDKSGKVFKWHAYGNTHHVEILKSRKTGKYSGNFITMMEAHARCKGIKQDRKSIVETNHGPDVEYIMALHINDTVSVEINGNKFFYRVQTLERPYRISLRLNTAATLDNKKELIRKSINTLMTDFKIEKHDFNVIGKSMNDQKNN